MSKKAFAAAAISIAIIAVFMLNQSFNSQPQTPHLTILNITDFYVEQEGHVGPDDEWTGSFWNIIALNDIAGSEVSLLKFNKTLVEQYGANWILDNNVQPTAQIDITMTAQQPYYTLPTVLREYMVYPQVYSTYRDPLGPNSKSDRVTIPQLDARVWSFTPEDAGSWTQHTPFNVQIRKVNGSNPFTWNNDGQPIDTLGGQHTITVANPNDESEKVMIKDLGVLGTSWQAGPPYSHVVILEENQHAFAYTSQLLKDMCYDISQATGEKLNDHSYSQYWFGGGSHYTTPGIDGFYVGNTIARWGDDYSPAAKCEGGAPGFEPDQWPGWQFFNDNGKWYNTPVAADIFNDDPNTWSETHHGIGKSLVNYLSDIRGYSHQNLDTWGEGKSIQPDGQLRVNMPFGAASSLVQIRVSTELADAIVVRESITNPQITSCLWLSNGEAHAVISDHDVAVVSVEQIESVTGPVYVKATLSPEDTPAMLDRYQLQRQMAYGETYDFKFTLTNNNPGDADVSGKVVFEALNSNGEVCSTAELTFTLPPKGPQTTLTVFTVDKETKEYLSGIPVSVRYGVDSEAGLSSGGSVSFDLASFVGTVTVTAEESTYYQGATATKTVQSGSNTVTLELLKKGVTPPPDYSWLLWVLIAVAVAIALVAVFKKRKRRRKA